jgi:hypothetical protein
MPSEYDALLAATSESPSPTAPSAAGKVRVKSPDGKIGLIPAEHLQQALSQGYACRSGRPLKRLVGVLGEPFIWLRGYFIRLVGEGFFRALIEIRMELLDLDDANQALNIACITALRCWHDQNFSLFEHWTAESEKCVKVFQQRLDAWKCKYGPTAPPNQIRFPGRSKMPTPDKAA